MLRSPTPVARPVPWRPGVAETLSWRQEMKGRVALSAFGIVLSACGVATAQATTERVSVGSSGGQGNGDSGIYALGSPNSMGIAISADGNVVAFGSDASNLVAGDTNHSR